MADDVAEHTAFGAQHAQAPGRLGHHVQYVGEHDLGWYAHAVFQVLVALADDLQVEGQHQGRAFGGFGAVDQALDVLTIAHHVELEPEGLAGGLGHILDRADAHGRKRERHAEFLGGARGQDFTVGPLHAGQADRGERGRHGDRLTDHGGRRGARLDIDGDALAQLQCRQVGAVGAIGAFGIAAGVHIVIERLGRVLLMQLAQIFDAGDDGHVASWLGLAPE